MSIDSISEPEDFIKRRRFPVLAMAATILLIGTLVSFFSGDPADDTISLAFLFALAAILHWRAG